MMYSHIQLYVYIYIYNYKRKQSTIMTTSMNKRTHFFRKIYLSHFILERVAKGLMLVVCER